MPVRRAARHPLAEHERSHRLAPGMDLPQTRGPATCRWSDLLGHLVEDREDDRRASVKPRSKIPRLGDAANRIDHKIKPNVAHLGEASPSVARALSDLEKECLAAIALALPASWVVSVEPPHGQVAITPVAERNRFHRCWVASGHQRRIWRDDGLNLR